MRTQWNLNKYKNNKIYKAICVSYGIWENQKFDYPNKAK